MSENMEEKKKDSEKKESPRIYKFDIIALILCFVAALGVWLFVMHTDQNIEQTKIFVSVDVADQVKDATGYDIISQNDGVDYSRFVVELTVSGTKKALEKYDGNDFKIVIKDLDDIKGVGVRTLLFDIPVLPGNDIEIVQMSPGYLSPVFIDIVKERDDVPLTAGFVGRVEEGIKIDENSIKPIEKVEGSAEYKDVHYIKILGPQSIINTVGSVKVVVDVTGSQKSAVSKEKNFEFYDKWGVLIDNKYNYIKVEPAEIEVQVVVKYENKKVPINVSFSMSPGSDDLLKYKYEYTIAYADGTNEIPSISLSGNSSYFPESLNYNINVSTLENYTVKLGHEELEKFFEEYNLPEITLGSDEKLDREIVITVTKTEIKTEISDNDNVSTN